MSTIDETKDLVQKAFDKNDVITIIRKDNLVPTYKERFVVAIDEYSFTHTSASSSSVRTVLTEFSKVDQIVTVPDRISSNNRSPFDYTKVHRILHPKEKQKLKTYEIFLHKEK